MKFRAVKNRCAVDFNSLNLAIAPKEALIILQSKGFSLIQFDIIEAARKCIGVSEYRRGARLCEASAVVDCSSFTKWLYGQRGIWLPRRSIQQREHGEVVGMGDIVAGDGVFVSGFIDYYYDDPRDGVGHVGIATGSGTVIHAANKKSNVIETSLESFVNGNDFRGVRRYIPKDREVLTLEVPPNREVETSDDLRWIILQSIK